jgi:hypothetical protein
MCGEILTEEEAESVGDIGCSSCRRTFDMEDVEPEEVDEFNLQAIL